jgi:hypothetical protein
VSHPGLGISAGWGGQDGGVRAALRDLSLYLTSFPKTYLGHKAAPWLQDMRSNVQSLWAGQMAKGEAEAEVAKRDQRRTRAARVTHS